MLELIYLNLILLIIMQNHTIFNLNFIIIRNEKLRFQTIFFFKLLIYFSLNIICKITCINLDHLVNEILFFTLGELRNLVEKKLEEPISF